MIYFDHAATSYWKPPQVVKGICSYLENPGNPDRGTHQISMNAARFVLETRIKLAQFFDADSFERVIFTSGLTESLNTVIKGLFGKEDHIITTIYEHNSVLRPLYQLQQNGTELSFCKSVDEMRGCIKKNTKAMIVNHASNVTGDIQDIKKIGELCHENGILFILDSGQSAGIIPISMKENYIDILCFSGHKGLLGMQGIGGIILNKEIKINPLKVGGSGIKSFDHIHPMEYPTALEAGTLNVPGIVSLYYSLQYLTEYGIQNIYKQESELYEYCYEKLLQLPGVKVYRKEGKHVGVISFQADGFDNSYIGDELSYHYNIAVRTGAHCAPLIHEYYHTESLIRVSFGIQNTKEEIDVFMEALKEILGS